MQTTFCLTVYDYCYCYQCKVLTRRACYLSPQYLEAELDKHAPLQTRTIVVRQRVPWYSEEIRHVKRERRRAERKWRSSKLDFDLAAFKAKRNAVTNLMNKERGQFYTNFIEENSCDQKKLFRAGKRLFNQSQDDGLPPNLHAPTFVRDIGKYFVAKIYTIQKQLNSHCAVDNTMLSATTIARPSLFHRYLPLRLCLMVMLNCLFSTLPN